MAIYESEFQGATIDARLAAVATMQTAISNLESAVAAKYSKPSSGIPETDLDASVQAALALARTAIQSLSDYYTKAQVDDIAAAIAASVDSTSGVVVTTLPSAGAGTLGKIYYVGPDANGFYDRYVTSYDGSTYSWLALGNTEVDMTQYATVEQFNQLDQKVDKNYGIIVGKVAKDFNVTTGVSYSSQDLQVRMFIPANQPFNFTVHDKTCVSSGKYGLNLYYSDGTSSNPVNPDLNSTVTRTAAKDVVAVGPYISSGKITTAGVLELILENPATMGADVAENTNGIAELDKRTNAIESESGSMTRRFSVKPSVTYDFLDLYLPIHIEKGMQFTFLLQDITSTSSGAFALRQFYADGTNANTSTNPTFNTQFTGTAAKEIVALGAYVSTGKITVAGFLEAQAYNGEFAGSRVFTVGTNGDFQTFTAMLRGLRNILGNKTVYVEAGEYDIFDEIGGAEYVASIDTSQTDWNDVADAVPANTTIIGKGTVILKWMPNASDIGSDAKANLFSPLTLTKGNCRIENIEIQCQNCRYGLHDETGQNVKGSVHEFINVKVTHYADTYGLKYAYGGGHSANSKRVFRNCEFVAYYGNVFAEHDWLVSADEGSEFVFENCLIYDPRDATHTPLYFTSSAQNGKIDKVFLSNCYVPNKIHFASGSASGEYNQSYEVTMIGCNAVTATRSENIVNEIEIRQYLSHE